MGNFSSYIKRVLPLPTLKSMRLYSIEYDKDGKPKWETVPLNTPVKFYVTKKGNFSKRKTSVCIKGKLESKVFDPFRKELFVRISQEELTRINRIININYDWFSDTKFCIYPEELKLDISND